MNMILIRQVVALRRKSLIALAIAILVAISSQMFMKYYHEPMLERQRTESLKLRDSESRGAALQSRDVLYKNGIADLAKFRGRIYLKSQFARFISELYDQAAKNSLELTAVTFKPVPNKEEQLLDYQLAVSVSGKYAQLKKFIYDLGSSSNILVIDSISLASTDTSADTVQLQIQMTSYFRLEGQ